jgi:DNA-binding NarL/FixJ family response regulator
MGIDKSKPDGDAVRGKKELPRPAVALAESGLSQRRLGVLLEHGNVDLVTLPASGSPRRVDVLVLASPSADDAGDELGRLRESQSEARLVLVVDASTPAEARRLLVDDVRGLVLAEQADATLVPAVCAVAAGQISYPAELMPTALRASLSTREKQVLGMVVLGFSNGEIANKLYVSTATVKSHLNSAFATIGVRTRNEAVELILDPNGGFGTGILSITS